jgi:hypothetical protein
LGTDYGDMNKKLKAGLMISEDDQCKENMEQSAGRRRGLVLK